MTYLIGNAKHSGIKEMLHALQIRNIIDKYNFQGETSRYGVRDKDLFERAKLEIRSKVTQDLPFALFLSTTDTHHPNGIYDSRMETIVSPKKSDLEFMISAVDYMVGDFINFLERENILSNTVVFVFPDHLKMGDPAIFKGTGDRGLYLLTNSADKDLAIDTSEVLYQIDLPRIILNGAGVKHNQKFLTDYISGDKNEFIRNNLHEITVVNTVGFLRIGAEKYIIPPVSDNYERYKSDTTRFIAHAGGMIEGNTYTNSLEALNLNYDKGFRLFELDILKTKDDEYVAAHDWNHWSEIANYEGELPVTHEEFIRHKILGKYTPLDMKRINDWFTNHVDATLVTDKINEPEEFSGKFIDKKRLIMELFDIETVKKGVSAQIKTSMPSQNVIDNLTGNKVKQLKQLGVNGIAISRTYIASNVEFLQELKENNVRVYVYGLNQAPGTDEDYVVKYEMDYIYGIYADKWDF
jgi:glycerophosphoryl diester phosphodiesterase